MFGKGTIENTFPFWLVIFLFYLLFLFIAHSQRGVFFFLTYNIQEEIQYSNDLTFRCLLIIRNISN
jgi:hypothetical protein